MNLRIISFNESKRNQLTHGNYVRVSIQMHKTYKSVGILIKQPNDKVLSDICEDLCDQ